MSLPSRHLKVPADGWAGLRQHWAVDATAGFIIFLLALPLSLGIARASEFPPIMGLVTAIVGGLVVAPLAGSPLTIKGPAAGLIVVVAGAVADFGGGELGWRLTLGALVVAGVLQILFGVFRLGRLVDIFPLSAVHGMLAAIGIIIIAKQIPVLLHVPSAMTKDKGPLELLGDLPVFIAHLDPRVAALGLVGLAVMMGWPYLKSIALRRVPAPMVVLLVAMPAARVMDFQHTEPPGTLVRVGSLLDNAGVHLRWDGLAQPGIFVKYVLMFALIGTLESLLTVRAIDMLDPYCRKSDANKDLVAIGIGNTLAAILGGLPMIAEVARSSANANNGARTRWANFFHGAFLLVFVLLATPLIEMIPNTVLAAMLIAVGFQLAHPKVFRHIFRIGKEQLAVFLTTIFFTLYKDLLVGILMGAVLEILLHLLYGAPLWWLFRAPVSVSLEGEHWAIKVEKLAVFTNWLSLKNKLEAIPAGEQVKVDLSETALVDHSVMENLHHFERDYTRGGGQVQVAGLEAHRPLSNHPLAARKKAKLAVNA